LHSILYTLFGPIVIGAQHAAHYIIINATTISLLVGALCTLGIFSLLYRENPIYRFCEHMFIGIATGYGVFITWSEVLKPRWWDPMITMGQWWWAFAVVAGAMFYFIYSSKHSWISKVIFGSLMGVSGGQAFQGFANGTIPQIEASFKPLVAAPGTPIADAFVTVGNNLIFVVVMITVMAYFFFSIDHKAKSMRSSAALGRWFLMFAFGAMFGATVMARMALFIGRVDFLTTDVFPLTHRVPHWVWFYLIHDAIVIAIVIAILWRRKPKSIPPDMPDAEPPAESA
jgi:hypothetical protein